MNHWLCKIGLHKWFYYNVMSWIVTRNCQRCALEERKIDGTWMRRARTNHDHNN